MLPAASDGGKGDWTPRKIDYRPLKIGNIEIGFPIVQAALSGYSDWPMRKLAREYGASYTLCEVMLDQFLVNLKDRNKNRHFLYNTPDEQPVAGQLMGAEPEQFSRGAERLAAAGFSVIDINFGCPVKKVVCKNAGAGILRDIPLMVKLTEAMVKRTNLPVTVKTRLGWDSDSIKIVEVAERLQDVGIKAISIHGRTRVQMYKGHADWKPIAAVKN
ncbi:MAG TPA: hypothetical protein DDW52_06730, partial [Planctomycetaceae bacterium]|nr:hypothetical protein [Planctomycetaceae bacterium]